MKRVRAVLGVLGTSRIAGGVWSCVTYVDNEPEVRDNPIQAHLNRSNPKPKCRWAPSTRKRRSKNDRIRRIEESSEALLIAAKSGMHQQLRKETT
jgi:hypothetical protein